MNSYLKKSAAFSDIFFFFLLIRDNNELIGHQRHLNLNISSQLDPEKTQSDNPRPNLY